MNPSNFRQILLEHLAQVPEVLDYAWIALPQIKNQQRLVDWIHQDRHGTMHFMQNTLDKRIEPRLWFDAVQSVVLLLFKYPAPLRPLHIPDHNPKLAAYAQGPDYHIHIREKLSELVKVLNAITNLEFKFFSDASPVFERELAALAGLGWRGKNCCHISEKLGSGFFLCGFMLNLNCDQAGVESPDRCGSCTRCLTQCPTQAFLGPGIIDAKRCISYLTIEYAGYIAESFWEPIGNRFFGCDICQEVCPWNAKHLVETPSPLALSLEEWLDLLKMGGGFNRKFKGTPLLRAGRKKILRNISIVCANQKRQDLIPQLETCLMFEKEIWLIATLQRVIEKLRQ
jgi:epoxyqueuosine reductase